MKFKNESQKIEIIDLCDCRVDASQENWTEIRARVSSFSQSDHVTDNEFQWRHGIGIDIEEKVNIVLGIVSIRKSHIGPSLPIR